MKQNRYAVTWLFSFLRAVGLAALFLLPLGLTATPAPDQSTTALPPEPTTYDPAVQQLLDTTYLGHTNELPDLGEPAEVLQKYLEQNAHGYQDQLATQAQKLDTGLAIWQNLVQRYPNSRHAQVALAKHYRAKALASGDIAYTRQAADAYISAAKIGLENGRIRYTRELSELLGELGDRKGLDEVFGGILAQPKDIDRDHYYLALVHYADGLAGFSDDRAWSYFEDAIALHPENNLEAINRYAKSLLDRAEPQKALEVLDTHLTPEMRTRHILPVQLRKQALEQAGLDTASADAEIALITQRLAGGWSVTSAPSRESTVASTETSSAGSETAVMAASVHDPRVSAVFAIRSTDSQLKQDAIFSPNSAMNDRWLTNNTLGVTGKSLAAIKWPDGRAGLFRIGTDNVVYYRYFNGSAWQKLTYQGNQQVDWLPLSGSAIDITAVVWPNNEADVLRVDTDQCNVYVSHSTNGQTWGAWNWWGSCGDQIAVAALPDFTAWAMLRVPTANNIVVKRYFNGTSWDGTWSLLPGTQQLQAVNDIDLIAHPIPLLGVIRMSFYAVGADNSTVYVRTSAGPAWSDSVFWTSGYKKVSSFSTDDGGLYLLFLGSNNNNLYTQRFSPAPANAWTGITPQNSTRTWIATAGVNIDDDSGNAYEHTESADDCRAVTGTPTSGYICDNFGNCYYTQGVNLAEIIYNEAQAETPGARETVGWTVRDRAFESLNPPTCDSYVGAEGGGLLTATCRSTVPCNDPNFCGNTQRYCCVMHGGQTKVGTSGYQFNDEHVDINTLVSSGVMDQALWVGNGLVPDVSTNWCPPGVGTCHFDCAGPWSDGINFNFSDASPHGPMEFLDHSYTPTVSSCKQVSGFVCPNATPNNYFWNRR